MLDQLRHLIRETFPLNRVVALATPLVAAVAAAFAGWLVDVAPGFEASEATITAAVASVGLGVVAIAYRWLIGWQAYEERQERPLVPGEVDDTDFLYDPALDEPDFDDVDLEESLDAEQREDLRRARRDRRP